MTVPARNTGPTVTDGSDVRVRVHGREPARVVPIRPDTDVSTAYTHAIPRSPQPIKQDPPGKIRNFVSQHAGEARQSLADSWLGQDRPQNLTTIAKQLKTGNPAALFRLAVYTIAYLMCVAVDTNKRAAVTAALLGLSLATAWTLTLLNIH